MTFESSRNPKIQIKELTQEIASFMSAEPNRYYELIIGSDSQVHHVRDHFECAFVTAIVVHRVGSGAKYFWSKESIMRKPGLREKIYTETYRSLETANVLVPSLRDKIEKFHYELEIHVDVGNVGPTRELIREIVGMVVGNGFRVKTKPESWAASSVADKHT